MEKSRSAESPLERLITESAEIPDLPLARDYGQQMEVNVLYTAHARTLAALKTAAQLAANLGTCPKVLRLYAVPYSLPLEKPAVPIGFLEEQIRALARQSPTEITARIILCREPRAILRQILPPHSLIVMGGKKRWWPTREQRLASALRKDGHEVIFVDQE